MAIVTSILLEFIIISTFILVLFNLRKKLGLAPLYILLGSIQYFQVNFEKISNFKILGEYPIYPASIVLISAILFAILLIYIKEGVNSARALIIGILISNFFLIGLIEIINIQEITLRSINNVDVNFSTLFNIHYKRFLVGTIILLLDFALLVVVYQFFISKIKKPYFFLVLHSALFIVLLFDALAFNILLYYNTAYFLPSLIGHFIGKSIAALIFAIILFVYLTYIDKEIKSTSFIASQKRDILSIFKYRKKYFDLKVEKENVEKKLTAQFEKIITSISDGIVSLDDNWNYTFVNKQAGELFGKTPDSLIGKHIWTEFPDAKRFLFYKVCQKAQETKEAQYSQEYYPPFGKWFDNRIYPTEKGLTIYFTDITKEKKIELALIESEAFNKSVLSSLSSHIAVIDKSGLILTTNKAWNDFSIQNGETNLTRTSIGSNYFEVCSKAIAQGDLLSQEVLNGLMNVLQKKETNFSIEYPCDSHSEKRWFILRAEPFGIGTDKLVISHTNVTKRKIAEEERSLSYLKLKEAQRMAKIGSWEFNTQTKELSISDEMYHILEIDRDSTKNLYDAYKSKLAPKDQESITILIQNALAEESSYSFEYPIKSKVNKFKYLHEIGEVIKNENGKIIKLKGTIQDITKEKLVNDKLIQNNEALKKVNVELDRFAYSASHDLRSPLASLKGLFQIIEMNSKPSNEDEKKPFDLVFKTIDKMDKFISDILDYSINSRKDIHYEKINFEALIQSCWEGLEFMDINFKPDSKINIAQNGDFYTDKKRLEIILSNLISNAFKYHSKIKTEHFINITIAADSENATITIADNGIGIDKENIKKIFDMFHRATKLSTGSGMGLYILKETVDKLNGTIDVDSELDKGTTFTVTIPNSN
tara:strand:+ start:20254 stop:22887 length:2634 start_codon:yes stop_codon:yes gene_type:complete